MSSFSIVLLSLTRVLISIFFYEIIWFKLTISSLISSSFCSSCPSRSAILSNSSMLLSPLKLWFRNWWSFMSIEISFFSSNLISSSLIFYSYSSKVAIRFYVLASFCKLGIISFSKVEIKSMKFYNLESVYSWAISYTFCFCCCVKVIQSL